MKKIINDMYLLPVFLLLFAILLGGCGGGGGGNTHSSSASSTIDKWTAVPSGAPVSVDHTAIWTGSAMIVWGDSLVNIGGNFDPITNTWKDISSVNAPQERTSHTAIWTGNKMIIWGGISSNVNLNTGGTYNPVTDTWSATSTVNAPFGRRDHVAVWTGTEMIVWGGLYSVGPAVQSTNTGARYNPATDTWTAISTVNAPSTGSQAVWTGIEMIVWDGSVGGRYNPSTDTWRSISSVNVPVPRSDFTAVWTGTEMIVWGGWTGLGSLVTDTGGRYNPATDSWNTVTQIGAATARYKHTAVWTGTEMIVWGGSNGSGPAYGGNRYNPQINTWESLSSTNEPAARISHTAVWTGTEMIIWGGWDGMTGFATNNGGRYIP